MFPHLKPFLAAALNVGLVLAVKASVTAEYFGANNGIGFQVQAAYQSLQVRTLFSWGLVLILIILLFNHLIPRIRALGPRIRRFQSREIPTTHRSQDIEALKGIFTSRKSAPGIRLDGIGFSYGRGESLLQNVRLACRSSIRDARLPSRSGLPPILLTEVGLGGEAGKMPDELSGGMKKRAALARCFARVPDAILLDEPFSGLHRDARRGLWNTLLRLLALYPVPVVIVTHFPEEISSTPACGLYALRGKPATIAPVDGGGRY